MRVYVVTLEPECIYISVFRTLIEAEKMLSESGELRLVASYPNIQHELVYEVNGLQYAVESKDI